MLAGQHLTHLMMKVKIVLEENIRLTLQIRYVPLRSKVASPKMYLMLNGYKINISRIRKKSGFKLIFEAKD